ncbi:hypothetical protein NYE44_29725 [Paenibacillus sp. FSL L8-0493]|uniref:hypothetical protein n=1 Tax=Paenibacillus TaxID=44249 RepID=UPI00117D151E|nr:hypothetical protein [Paenibacillus odorifer]
MVLQIIDYLLHSLNSWRRPLTTLTGVHRNCGDVGLPAAVVCRFLDFKLLFAVTSISTFIKVQ